MESFSDNDIVKSSFDDINGFKDFVRMYSMCAPNNFLLQEWRSNDDQWTLEKAFLALQYGISLVAKQYGEDSNIVHQLGLLARSSFDAYTLGNDDDGYQYARQLVKEASKLRDT
jgi:hypothetical protein